MTNVSLIVSRSLHKVSTLNTKVSRIIALPCNFRMSQLKIIVFFASARWEEWEGYGSSVRESERRAKPNTVQGHEQVRAERLLGRSIIDPPAMFHALNTVLYASTA